MLKRAIVVPLAALLLLAAASADAGWQGSASAGATAQAQAIRVVVPNGPGGATPAVSAPDDHVAFSGGFTYEALLVIARPVACVPTDVKLVLNPSPCRSATSPVKPY